MWDSEPARTKRAYIGLTLFFVVLFGLAVMA